MALLWAIGVLSLAAAGVSIYLAVAAGHPVGCGRGSGCEQVLASRWSGVGPIPVGALAGAAYVVLIGCVGLMASARWGVVCRWMGAAIAGMLLGAAVWFVVLQVFVIRAICPYCMIDHGLGVVVGILVLAAVSRGGAGRWFVLPVAVGLLAVVGLIGGQLVFPHTSGLQRLPSKGNFDTGAGPERTIGIVDGTLRLEPHAEAMLGSPDAKHVLVGLFDYACPHCRRTHEYLADIVRSRPDELAVIALPCPLNASCNPSITETEPRFVDSCELARIALAVHRAAPAAFPAFDTWLFEPEMPRTREEARKEAERVIGAEKLGAALADPELGKIIARNTAVFAKSGTDRLPILLSPEIGGIAGRPDSREELMKLLEKELHLSGGGG